MNQIYKVIWSRVKHCYVVVSEIAGRCGKNGGTASEKKSMPVRAFLCALAVTGCLLPGMAGASFHGGIGATTATANSIAVGDDAKTTEEYTIALGSRSRAINIYAIAMGDQAQATGQGATAIGSLSKSTAEHSLAVGDQAEAAAVNSSAYGILSKALSSHSVAIGNEASVGKGDPDSVSSQNGIAIGNGANVTVNPATATPGITDKSGGIAIGHDATTKDINTIALGTGTVGQGAQAVAIGRNARTIANNGVAIGNEARTQSTNGFALGNNARAGFDENNVLVGRDNDQAFGSNARAWGGSSMAFGNNAKAANGGAIAMGNGSQSRGDWGVAIGNGAKALAAGARALGANSTAKGVNSTAIGWDSKSEAASGIAVGESASVEDGADNGIAIGTGAKAAGKSSTGTPSLPASTVAIGQGAQALENGDIVIGRQAKSIASTEHGNPGSGAVVAGAEAAAYGARGDVVIGASAETNVKIKQSGGTVDPKYAQGVAIGSTAKTYGTQSLALGSDTRAIGNSSIAIGGDDIDMARTELEAAVPQLAAGNGIKKSFNKEIETKFTGGLGSASINVKGKYANTAAIGDATTAIGTLSEAYGTGSTAIGINSLTKGVASTGIGIMARSWGTNSLALGTQVGAYGDRSSSIGDTNQVGLDMKDGSKSGKESAAVGSKNTIYGNQAYAVGAGNTIGSATVNTATEANGSAAGADQDKITTVTAGTVKGNMAGAFGYKNTINADNAYAVGSNSTVSADGAMVLGNNASVTAKNGMALGSNTKVANENAIALGAGSETAAAVATPSATINGTAHNFAGVNPASTVSVGKAGSERTITNVAAGRISAASTDAINGSQLYAVTSEIDKGVAYAGDVKAAAAAANKFTRKLGEQTNIVGGVADTSKLTDGNIGVVSNGTDTLNIKLAKNVKVDSVTTGNTVINNNGLTVGGKTYVTNNGLNANNQKVTNVADGQVAAGSKDAVNGGQLHDAKNEVINKGLRFDADNNSEKTNKLGSKVTVNGDNNITTEITQTGDDTKIGVKLNEDIHVKTVTAADTVKAGGVTMGSQTSGGTTGNYVTGLDNKTWNVTNPTAVSGRAATEDQLKTVTEAINNQSAAATDYRLVQNASSADGSYTVDTNGDIDLTVEDKNHAGQKETVKLKDIASKSKLDDVINKGLQFDANVGGVQTNKLGSKITVKGEGTAADTDYSGENLKTFITQDPAGNTTIDVKMNKNLKAETVVATGENGKDGKIGINGKDGQTTNISVTRDGKPGVDGAPGTTTTRIVYEKPDGTKEEVATLNDGMKYGGDTGAVIKKKLNEQVNVVGGITDTNKLTTEDNLGVVSDGNNNLKVRMAKDLKGLESVKTGDTVINNNGVTINNGAAGNPVSLTKNGLNNGGNSITNVADGVNGTDAVNVNQLKKVKAAADAAKVHFFSVKGNSSDENYNNDGATGDRALAVGVAAKAGGLKATALTGGNASGDFSFAVGNNAQAKGWGSVAIGAGTLAEEQGTVAIGHGAKAYSLESVALGYNTQAGAPSGQPGAGNHAQTAMGSGTIATGGAATAFGFESVASGAHAIAGGDKAKATGQDSVALGKDTKASGTWSVALGSDTKAEGQSSTALGTDTTASGIASTAMGSKTQATGVGSTAMGGSTTAAGNWSLASGGLSEAKGDYSTAMGYNSKANARNSFAVSGGIVEAAAKNSIAMGEGAKASVSDAVALGSGSVASTEKGKIGYDVSGADHSNDTTGVWKSTANAVSVGDVANYVTRQITGVAAGTADTDAVNVAQLKKVAAKAAEEAAKHTTVTAGDYVTVTETETNGQKNYTVSGPKMESTDGSVRITDKMENGKKVGYNLSVDTSSLGIEKTKVEEGDNVTVTSKKTGNTTTYTVSAKDTVVTGGTATYASNGTGSATLINNDGTTATITGLQDRYTSSASLNGDTLNFTRNDGSTYSVSGIASSQDIKNVTQKVGELGTRVNRVGAGAAALAALHPLDFDPDDKWDVAAGYGNYKDAHAVSVGAFYRPNEDTMFSVGGSFGGGENMVNAGVSVKLGQGNHVSTSKVAMAKEIVDLKDAVTRLEAQNEQFRQIIGQMAGQPVRNVEFPDVPKDHWAYSYVKSLADRGLLEGYPDGEFKGDRSMTRYEFAAIIYRALQNGAPVDGNMGKAMEEFGPEMEKVREAYRFRVDRISGGDNDRNKVERVRVNNKGNKEKGDYRDIYGSHIAAGK